MRDGDLLRAPRVRADASRLASTLDARVGAVRDGDQSGPVVSADYGCSARTGAWRARYAQAEHWSRGVRLPPVDANGDRRACRPRTDATGIAALATRVVPRRTIASRSPCSAADRARRRLHSATCRAEVAN